MAVKYIFLYGTKDEIDDTLDALPKRTTDRLLVHHTMYPHMIAHLEMETWQAWLSKVELTPRIMEALHAQAEKFPNMLYKVTDRQHRVFNHEPYAETYYCNYSEHDSAFPGPFGALCKVYGKTYY